MENIILVDTNDKPLGEIEKLEAHKTPRLHRAFSVFLYNDKGEILIQKRAQGKYHSGGKWANSCCSHPRAGKTFEQSVSERLLFELGVKNVEWEEIFSFTYLTEYAKDLYEYEFDHVLVAQYNGEVFANKEEIENVAWVKVEDIEKMLVKNPTMFASWFVICAPIVFAHLRKIQAI